MEDFRWVFVSNTSESRTAMILDSSLWISNETALNGTLHFNLSKDVETQVEIHIWNWKDSPMTEEIKQPTSNNKGSQMKGGDFQYQHQTLTLNNTIGLLLMSTLAFALLVALLRKQARYEELALQLARQRNPPTAEWCPWFQIGLVLANSWWPTQKWKVLNEQRSLT